MYAERISVIHVASCAAYLPPNGAVAYESHGKTVQWDIDTLMISDVANSLRWLVWSKTKNGQKNRKRPTMLEPPKQAKEKPQAYEVDKVKEILRRKRI